MGCLQYITNWFRNEASKRKAPLKGPVKGVLKMKLANARKRKRVHQQVEMFEMMNQDTIRAHTEVSIAEVPTEVSIAVVPTEVPIAVVPTTDRVDESVPVTPKRARAMKKRIALRQECWDNANDEVRQSVLDAIEKERVELMMLKAEEPTLEKKSPAEIQE